MVRTGQKAALDGVTSSRLHDNPQQKRDRDLQVKHKEFITPPLSKENKLQVTIICTTRNSIDAIK